MLLQVFATSNAPLLAHCFVISFVCNSNSIDLQACDAVPAFQCQMEIVWTARSYVQADARGHSATLYRKVVKRSAQKHRRFTLGMAHT